MRLGCCDLGALVVVLWAPWRLCFKRLGGSALSALAVVHFAPFPARIPGSVLGSFRDYAYRFGEKLLLIDLGVMKGWCPSFTHR